MLDFMKLIHFSVLILLISEYPAFGSSPVASIRPLGGPRDTDSTTSKEVVFEISKKYSAKISPWIYGANIISTFQKLDSDTGISYYRQGGNRLSAYNWENNYSHAGSDYHYQNDRWLCSLYQSTCKKPGGVVSTFVENSFSHADSVLLTVPIIGYVAFKYNQGDVCRTKPDKKTWKCPTNDHLKLLFRKSVARKSKPLSLTPDQNDGYVYQDEFVNWVKHTFAKEIKSGKNIFYSLDNEPALWGHTHNRIRPYGKYCKSNVTYPELLKLNLEYAKMVKDQVDTIVFGPAHYGFSSILNLQNVNWCTKNKESFYEYYLSGLNRAKLKNGNKHLIDVWDIHWYPEVRSDGKKGTRITRGNIDSKTVNARLQAPRSLWDPTFDEKSWITQDSLGKPLRLIPRLHQIIDQFNPGMGLSISEYTYGGEHHISGGITQSEVLGVYGREGLYAANFWPLADEKIGSDYIKGAFKIYRNYDGKGSQYGDIAYSATTNSISKSSVFSSIHSKNPTKLLVMAINKTDKDLTAKLKTSDLKLTKKVELYQLTSSSPNPKYKGISVLDKNYRYIMPPLSVSLLVIPLEKSDKK